MTVREAGFISDPRVQFLPALLDEIRAGMIQVPRFQRPFVWSADKQLELLRSVREGLPIGSLMIWQTRRAVSASDLLGERKLPPPSADALHKYLLDGQQRTATLYAALIPLSQGEAPPLGMAYFDLEANDFVMRAEPPGDGEGHLLDLRIVLDSIKLRKAQRAFPDDRAEAWIERSDEVSIAFKDYKVALIPIATDNLDLAIKTFERVNTQGTQMGGVHMVHALSWSEGFHLLDRMETLRRERLASMGWDEIEDERILDVCRMRLGMPLETRGERLASGLRASPGVLDEAVEDVARVAVLLRECHVRSPKLLPYRHQLLVLSTALRELQDPSEQERGRLIAWFWVSALTGWFEGEGSAARSRLLQSVDQIAPIARGDVHRPFGRRERKPLGPSIDVRSGRGRSFVLLLASLHPLDASGGAVDLAPLLDGERLDVTWMIRWDRLESEGGSPGNRFLLPVHEIVELSRRLRDPKKYPWQTLQRVAESHAITEGARQKLASGDERGFVRDRRRALDACEELLLDNYLTTLA